MNINYLSCTTGSVIILLCYFKSTHCKADFAGMWHIQWQRPHTQKDPTLHLVLCCCCIESFNDFWIKESTFLFCLTPDSKIICSILCNKKNQSIGITIPSLSSHNILTYQSIQSCPLASLLFPRLTFSYYLLMHNKLSQNLVA